VTAAPGVSPIGAEILDDPGADPRLVARMLEEIARANRWFGGRTALLHGLRSLTGPADRGRTLTLLDIGTGAGDLPRAATEWCGRRGVSLRAVAVERHATAARLALANGVPTVVGCGSRPPLADRSVDLVLLSQVLHHLDDAGALALIGTASRLARRGVIVADLRPSRAAGVAFRLAGGAMGFARSTVVDGITSLARGRDRSAMTALLAQAGIAEPEVTRLPFARIVATWRVAN
jgi:hypothetical protein